MLTVAIEGLLLIHAPPEVGAKVVVLPIQITFGPVMDVVGFETTFISLVGSETHEELVSKRKQY